MFATTPATFTFFLILLFTTFLPALAAPLPNPEPSPNPNPAGAPTPALSGPGPIALPDGNSYSFNPPARSKPPHKSSSSPESGAGDTLSGLTSMLGSPSSSPTPLGSTSESPLGGGGGANPLSALAPAGSATGESPLSLLGRTYVQNTRAMARRVDDALAREIAALEIAREADGYAGLAPGVPTEQRSERLAVRVPRANRLAPGYAVEDADARA
ncbi:unnamed protein product [Cyclocybe aegerita]|uniref:Uncharacterized protein n=1 Tax=Cyclocybe aegerita TaxID=1973307 RepID=A0A8S0VQR9_CYCAE|nr:unnamed protein product [Cyclocybe aegerita]